MARKKVLMVASVASMIGQFNMENIRLLQELGYEVYVACNFIEGSTWKKENSDNLKKKLHEMGVETYQIDFSRSPLHIGEHKKAYNQLLDVMTKNNYLFAHCHSPIGGAITRFVCKKTRTKCIYTAHGFHFYKGGPVKSWLLFYPIEKILSKYTDILITINQEDYELAKSKFHAKKVVKVPGVGIDTNKFKNISINKKEYRKKLGLSDTDFVILSVGELNENKNHKVIIEAIRKLKNSHIKYIIAGEGNQADNLTELANKYGVLNQLSLLGYRTDIPELCQIADVFAFPSKREGLGLAAVEAMVAGKPIITSNVGGINDYSQEGITGYKCNPDDVDGFAKAIMACYDDKESLQRMGQNNQMVAKKYDISKVDDIMTKVYFEI